MIVCATYENLHKYGQAFYSQFRLRHQCFIERQSYDVSEHHGMEFDQYDTPAAVYLVYLSPHGEAWGCSRLTPVNHGSMLQDLWPDLVDQPENIFTHGVWEGTRFCIEKTLPVDLRRTICQELVVGYFEAGLDLGIQRIIGVMPPAIFRTVFGGHGCQYNFLGKKIRISSGENIAAAAMDITANALDQVRRKIGMFDSVLERDSNIIFSEKNVA